MGEAIAKEDKRITVNIKTAARLFDVKEQHLRMMCLLGKIPGAKRLGKYWFIPYEELEKTFMNKKEDGDGRK
ncbi:MAG: hypothetical protein M1510_01560 [Nitrospirae bacterium]|nr:hypothetical protein [Nitrospirota bacterium]MCL5238627.1 hypothetical protein [Nitrospirota bacterium]